jgi:F0F1-type ATP synthase assembly protein I
MTEPPVGPPKRAAWFRATDASSIGIEIAVAITIGAVGGHYLERYVTHWSPWTSLLGIAIGLAAATKAVVRTARTYTRELREHGASEPADDKRDDHG